MKPTRLKKLRERAEKRTICMGMGGEETFVNGSDMILPRQTVIALVTEIERLQELQAPFECEECGHSELACAGCGVL